MAVVNNAGVQRSTLAQITAALEQAAVATFGADVNLQPESPIGQMIGIIASYGSQLDDAIVAVSNGSSLIFARGRQLDDLGEQLGIPRNDDELDDAYRARIIATRQRSAVGSIAAMQSVINAVDGITEALVRDNPTNTADTSITPNVAARSIAVFVDKGTATDSDIGTAIAASKPLGVPIANVTGATSVSVPRTGNSALTVYFAEVAVIQLQVSITMTTSVGFPALTGFDAVRTALTDFVNGRSIGEAIDAGAMQAVVYNAAPAGTIAISAFSVTRVANNAALGTPTLAERFKMTTDNITFA